MADFESLLEEEAQRTGGQKLKVDEILGRLDDETRDKVLTALHGTAKDPVIARALSRIQPTSVTDGAVRNWRIRHGVRP